MKKFIMAMLLLLGATAGIQAETLREAYDNIASVEGAKRYDEKETAKKLVELNSILPMETCESVSWPFENGSIGVTEGFDALRQMLADLEDVEPVITVDSRYNIFLLLASADGDNKDTADVMAVWQRDLYGEVYVVYGQMSRDDFRLLEMGNVQMTHFGVSIQPMPKAYYEKLQRLFELQQSAEQAKGVRRADLLKKETKDLRSLEKKVIRESGKTDK